MVNGEFEVHAGDFKKGKHHRFIGKHFHMIAPRKIFGLINVQMTGMIKASEVEEISIATEENVKKLGGTVGWGIAGGVLLGPVGLLAGLLAGGNKKQVTFVCKFKDGRKFLATAPSKLYTEISASVF